MNIKNVILDLGGVLYRIDYHIVTNKLRSLPSKSGKSLEFTQANQNEIFDLFEKGLCTSAEFRLEIRNIYNLEISDNEIDEIWNSMLLGLYPFRTEFVKNLSQKYNTALLSNANQIHYNFIQNEIKPMLNEFHKVYFSFNMGMRKPNADIFEKVLNDNGWNAEESIFVDDTEQHIKGAQKVGLQTLHLKHIEDLSDELDAILNSI